MTAGSNWPRQDPGAQGRIVIRRERLRVSIRRCGYGDPRKRPAAKSGDAWRAGVSVEKARELYGGRADADFRSTRRTASQDGSRSRVSCGARRPAVHDHERAGRPRSE